MNFGLKNEENMILIQFAIVKVDKRSETRTKAAVEWLKVDPSNNG